MDNYEVLIEKWKNCTMEEWIAGLTVSCHASLCIVLPDLFSVIMVKYSKILEFVKTHMTYGFKVPSNLFVDPETPQHEAQVIASFDKQVDSHGVVLEERQKVLAGGEAEVGE